MTYNEASIDSDYHPLASLCGLATFVTNSEEMLKIFRRLTPAEVSVLCSLLGSTPEISNLAIREELPEGTGVQLGSAISTASTILALTLGHYYEVGVGLTSTPELLRTLAASPNAALERLSIDHLYIREECMTALCDSFGKFTALRSFSVAACDVSDSCISSLIAGIGKLRALESLHTEGIAFTPLQGAMLITALKDLPILTDLLVHEGGLGAESGQLIGSLVALGRLWQLDLRGNLLFEKEVRKMVDTIVAQRKRSMCQLRVLNLIDSQLGPMGLQKVQELAEHSPHLRSLNLGCNPLTGSIFQPQLSSKLLEDLDVTDCNLGPHAIESMLGAATRAFSTHSTLSVLRISGNSLRNPGAKAVAQFIFNSEGRTLIELWMRHCGVAEAGALELAKAFVKAYKLQVVDMIGNPIGPQCAAAVIDALAAASAIPMDAIRLGLCGIGDVGAEAAGRLIRRRGCRCFGLNGNEIHVAGVEAIADSIVVCSIRDLDLSENPIGDEGVKYLLEKVISVCQQSRSRGMRQLNIVRTGMGVEGAMAVERAVAEAHGMLDRLKVSRQTGDERADGVLGGVEAWERDSKSAGTAILCLR